MEGGQGTPGKEMQDALTTQASFIQRWVSPRELAFGEALCAFTEPLRTRVRFLALLERGRAGLRR